MRRTTDYDEQLSQELRDPEFAREFLLTLIEGDEGLNVENALRHMIQRMGVKEASELTGMAAPNIVAFLKGNRHPKRETLDKLLRPFGLRTKTIIEDVREAS
jgi:DNA-binding phage protein